MNRDEVISALKAAQTELRERYRVRSVRIFGSVASDQAGHGSDIDIAVEFEGARDGMALFGAAGVIADRLKGPVDVIEYPPRDPELARQVDAGSVRAF